EKVDNELIEDTLEELLFNQKRVVTALTLARYADTKSKQAMSVMNEFFSRPDKPFMKKEKGLYGVYLLSGERKDRDELHRNASILVRENDLDATKETFSRIDECTLFSLQCIELEDLCHIFRADEEDNFSFLASDHERFGIVFTDLQPGKTDEEWAAIARKKMPNSFDVMKAYAAGKGQDVYAYKREEEEKKKKKEAAEHQRLESLIQKAVEERQKTPKASPSKASPFSTGKKSEKDEEASNSPILSRKRQRKIMLDNESEEEEEAVVSPKEREVKKRKGAEKPEKKKKRATIESDDDLFDASGESPVKKDIKEEEMDEDEVVETKSKKKGKKDEKKEKMRTLEESGGLRRSPRKQQATSSSSSSGPTKRFVQKDVTFVDANGMMGTRREMVEVEISEEELKKEKERE
ncbi:hypothetical protein PMAYCL1PPCAC_00339, partial [Pristionchus mayeri]